MDLYTYDTAGNLLNNGTHSYFYDAENRLIQVDGTLPYCTSNGASGSAATACYYYDANGRRIHRTGYLNDNCDSTGKRDYVYDLNGHAIVEVNDGGTACDAYLFVGDRQFSRLGGGTFFSHADWLGTIRLINSDANPTYGAQVCTSLPFGDGLTCNSYNSNVNHFTGKERDFESGLDNFGGRYNASSMGRFMTPDFQDDEEPPDPIPNGSTSNPQSLNLYQFVENNPISKTDPDGHATWAPCAGDPTAQCFVGDYNGERNCATNNGCLFWNSSTNQWERNDPAAPGPSDIVGWWFIGFVRLTLNDPYGFKQMGYAYGKAALLPFGGWDLLKPPGTSNTTEAGARPSIVPDNWIEKTTRKNNGKIYIDPNNPHNRVRVMDDGYMKVQKNGQCLDVNGNPVPSNSPEAHIPSDVPMKSPFIDLPIGDVPFIE